MTRCGNVTASVVAFESMPYVDGGGGGGSSPLPASYRYEGWLVWACAALFYGYQFTLRVSPSVMTNDLMHDFDIDAAVVGSIASAYYVSYATLQVPVGILMDRFGPRRCLLAASLAATCGALVFATASGTAGLTFGRLLIGCGASCGFLSCVKLASLWFTPDRMPIVIGITTAIGTIGAASAGGPLASSIASYGWRSTMTSIGCVGFAITALVFTIVKDGYGPNGQMIVPTARASVDPDESRSLMAEETRTSTDLRSAISPAAAGSGATGAGVGTALSPASTSTSALRAIVNGVGSGVAVNVFESAAIHSPLAAASAGASPASQSVELLPLRSSSPTSDTNGGTASALLSSSANAHGSSSHDNHSPTNGSAGADHSNAHANDTSSAGSTGSAYQMVFNIFRQPQTWIFAMYGLFAYPPISVLADMWATRFVAHAWQMDTTAAAFTVSFVYIGVGCGAPVWAYVSTQLVSHRRPMALGVAGALFWVCVVLYGPFVAFNRLPFIFFGIGFCISAQSLAFSAVVSLNPRAATGTATAIQNMHCMISGMLFQPIAGLALDYKHRQLMGDLSGKRLLDDDMMGHHHTAHFTFALSLVPVCLTTALVIVQWARETYPKPNNNTLRL